MMELHLNNTTVGTEAGVTVPHCYLLFRGQIVDEGLMSSMAAIDACDRHGICLVHGYGSDITGLTVGWREVSKG